MAFDSNGNTKLSGKNLKKAIQKLGKEYIKELTTQLLKSNKKATGSLLKSLDFDVVKTVDGFMLEIISNPYLKYIEGGRGANRPMPPVRKIIAWMKAKRIILKDKRTNKPLSAKQAGFIMARSIGVKGIKRVEVVKRTNLAIFQKKGIINDVLQGQQSDLRELLESTLARLFQ